MSQLQPPPGTGVGAGVAAEARNGLDPSSSAPDIRITGGNPSPEEIAAVTAVLHTALAELAEEANREESPVNAWAQSQRQLRGTLRPGPGAWRGFSA